MTNPLNYSNQSIPAYSGITINISNPTLNAAPLNTNCKHSQAVQYENQASQPTFSVDSLNNDKFNNSPAYGITNPQQHTVDKLNNLPQAQVDYNSQNEQNSMSVKENIPQAYPPQYYLNNYNYVQNGEKAVKKDSVETLSQPTLPEQTGVVEEPKTDLNSVEIAKNQTEEDMSSSQNIINELDTRAEEQKELEKNGKKTRVVALTNEYIMSLENYLNNPDNEIRLMAAKEILTRLDEDKERFDDAALNALLNKMLQDPNKLVRIAALSAFSSQLASGNDYTVKLLNDIQANPNSDKEDVIEAANILLKMSSESELKYTPINNNNVVEQQVVQQ